MKKTLRIAFLALVPLSLVGCASLDSGIPSFGQQARRSVMIPVLRSTWPGIKADATRGPTVPPDANILAFEEALNAGDVRTAAVTDWPVINAAVQSNIIAAPWSEGVKASHSERLANYSEALQKEINR